MKPKLIGILLLAVVVLAAGGYSFYRGDQLTLCMEAPHALGDYVFIEIDV